jgi:hypothetical protein
METRHLEALSHVLIGTALLLLVAKLVSDTCSCHNDKPISALDEWFSLRQRVIELETKIFGEPELIPVPVGDE